MLIDFDDDYMTFEVDMKFKNKINKIHIIYSFEIRENEGDFKVLLYFKTVKPDFKIVKLALYAVIKDGWFIQT